MGKGENLREDRELDRERKRKRVSGQEKGHIFKDLVQSELTLTVNFVWFPRTP